MYVVLGANGRAGGETAYALLEKGEAVRVVLRRPEQADKWIKLGADVAIASIEDVPSLVSAFRDASGAFVLSPPPVTGDPYLRAAELGRALGEAVRQSGVPKLVALSSIGAQHATGTGVIATLHRLEQDLAATAPSVTFLRPGYFVETWGEVAATVIAEGLLPSFLEPNKRIPMVSTFDVGRTAADLLSEDFSGRRVVELRATEDWSANDVAAAFSKVLARRVEVAFVAPEDRAAILTEDGVSPEVADALLGMYDGLGSGRVEYEAGNQQRIGSVPLAEAVDRMVRRLAEEGGRLPT